MRADELNRFRGCLLGLAVGDAVGTTVEFRQRGTFKPITDMVGGGPFRLAAGQWTDDTSMALCLATSLVEMGLFDANDQMQRYCRWMDSGYPCGSIFPDCASSMPAGTSGSWISSYPGWLQASD
jgi:ADP-ribosyl-[dinitrogen reductase] hydrolase